MGVYIKGMEMPFTCLNCYFRECAGGVGDFCSLTKRRQISFKNRPKDCPLIELPLHGKLIDADALKVSLVFAEKTAEWAVPALRAVLMVIDEMPTIIPADESKGE